MSTISLRISGETSGNEQGSTGNIRGNQEIFS